MAKGTKKLIKGAKGDLGSQIEYMNLSRSERLISIASGACILYGGIVKLFKKPKTGILKVAGGSALILRGATGYCPMRQAIDSPADNRVTIVEHRIV